MQLWVKRNAEEGYVLTRPQSGRNPMSTMVQLTRELDICCHPSTATHHLGESGLECNVPAVKQEVTEYHNEGRRVFATNIEYNRSLDFFAKSDFTYEKTSTSVAVEGRQCWRIENIHFNAENIFTEATR